MPFVKLKDKQPARYADTVFYYPKYDTCNRHRFLDTDGMPEDTEWLDESITEDMVNDLEFDGLPTKETYHYLAFAYGANQYYEIQPTIGIIELRVKPYKVTNTVWTVEQFNTLDEAIAEANRQNKKYILSQLK